MPENADISLALKQNNQDLTCFVDGFRLAVFPASSLFAKLS